MAIFIRDALMTSLVSTLPVRGGNYCFTALSSAGMWKRRLSGSLSQSVVAGQSPIRAGFDDNTTPRAQVRRAQASGKYALFSQIAWNSSSQPTRQGLSHMTRMVHVGFSAQKDSNSGKVESPQPKKAFLLLYTYVEGMLEKRGPHRAAHIALTQTFVAKGELLLGGAFADPVDGAAIVFLANSAEGKGAEVEQHFIGNDPYVIHGLVSNWSIRPWTLVVGSALPLP